MKILVYNNLTNKMETFNKDLNSPMPYTKDKYLSVKEFRGSSKSNILWTTRAAMDAFNKLRTLYGKPIKVGYAFKRIAEGGHAGMSQHYAGVAFDIAQGMPAAQRDKIRNLAIKYKMFTYVEPKILTPTWVHVDKRDPTPACPTGGYPLIKYRKKGVYVAVLQDALNVLKYNPGAIDAIFGKSTKSAVINFQKANNLTPDGIVGCNTWRAITNKI
ncbi:MAG: peptidoglycan-binding protein [Clostridia bacterium]